MDYKELQYDFMKHKMWMRELTTLEVFIFALYCLNNGWMIAFWFAISISIIGAIVFAGYVVNMKKVLGIE